MSQAQSPTAQVIDLQAMRKRNEDAKRDQQQREALQRILERAKKFDW
jgi:hypothetical protein